MATKEIDSVDMQTSPTLDNLLTELSHYRYQSQQLKKINSLYQRMAGVLDLPSMIETYSIWLMEYVPHELIGYHNEEKQRTHMFCSYHGPKRRLAIDIAHNILNNGATTDDTVAAYGEFHSHKWEFETTNCLGQMVLLKKDCPIPEEDLMLIDESLGILAEPLKRAIEYETVFAQSREDALTGLPNRFVLDEQIGPLMERARRYNHPLTLAALDLDHFKSVNDTMGHLIGDRVLQKVTKALQEQIRLTDLLVRVGGDEFLLVLPDTDMRAARHLAERLCVAISELGINTKAGELAVSIGLSEWQPGVPKEDWFEKADDILYQAKANGRGQVAVN